MTLSTIAVKSDEGRSRFRELLDHAENGGTVLIQRYSRPVAVMTRPSPNPLDDRIINLAVILRGQGAEAEADEIEAAIAYIREAWAGSGDGDIVESLDRISSHAHSLAMIARARASAARQAGERDGEADVA